MITYRYVNGKVLWDNAVKIRNEAVTMVKETDVALGNTAERVVPVTLFFSIEIKAVKVYRIADLPVKLILFYILP